MKRSPAEGRFSRVTRRMWNDEKFQRLSAPRPNAQTLWLRLLTGPELGCIPGLFTAREGGLMDALHWANPSFRNCWREIADLGMAFADWHAGLVWVPNAIVHNPPESPNVVKSWRLAWRELPECELKTQATSGLREHLRLMGPEWLRTFDEMVLGAAGPKTVPPSNSNGSAKPSGKPLRKPFGKPSPEPIGNQDQDQDQEQDLLDAAPDPSLTASARGAVPEAAEKTLIEPGGGQTDHEIVTVFGPPARKSPPTCLAEALPDISRKRSACQP